MPTLELNGKPFAEQTGTGEPVLKGNINFEGPIRINNQEVLSANGSGVAVSNLSKLSLTPSSAPSSPTQGDIYLDSSDYNLKIYNGTFWKNILSGEGIVATGGTITDITVNETNYRVHTFTTSGTFQVLSGSGEVEYLVIAGGGGGGSWVGGGGGAGGYRSSVTGESSGGGSSSESKLNLLQGNYTVIIGAGGVGNRSVTGPSNTTVSENGNNSSFSTIISVGGGHGVSWSLTNVGSGGSGGGGVSDYGGGGSGTTGQGYDGGTGVSSPTWSSGGGGGAGAIGGTGNNNNGGTAGHGGDGVQSLITGTATYYAGGGGGSVNTPSTGYTTGVGGAGGGGDGASHTGSGSIGQNATVNTGGGGGGSGQSGTNPSSQGGNGGSGIVIIRYQI